MKVALGVTGCIAAYKAVEVLRGLQKAGLDVQVILTRAARQFIGPLTFEALSTNSVISGLFGRGGNRSIQHIRIAQEIQLLAVVPATANVLGKFAQGIADDFLTTLYLSCPVPVLLAPAMNVEMWNHPAVRRNVAILRERGHAFVEPEAGHLACGMQGAGRLAQVESIVSRILELAGRSGSLSGTKVLVTAGPTVEDLDPIRFLSNRSSGKMGYAFAQAAALRGAQVTLVSGPTELGTPWGVCKIAVRSAAEMLEAVLRNYAGVDIVVKAAAVADFRPAEYSTEKIKKQRSGAHLTLLPTQDILAELGRRKTGQVLVGFAAESADMLAGAQKKMAQKNLDLIVANDITSGVFGSDNATVHIIHSGGQTVTLHNTSKAVIANRVLDMAQALSASRRMPPASG